MTGPVREPLLSARQAWNVGLIAEALLSARPSTRATIERMPLARETVERGLKIRPAVLRLEPTLPRFDSLWDLVAWVNAIHPQVSLRPGSALETIVWLAFCELGIAGRRVGELGTAGGRAGE